MKSGRKRLERLVHGGCGWGEGKGEGDEYGDGDKEANGFGLLHTVVGWVAEAEGNGLGIMRTSPWLSSSSLSSSLSTSEMVL